VSYRSPPAGVVASPPMDMSALPAHMSAREAAARCGVDERTVRRWIASGRLAADKRGGVFWIAPRDLAPFLPRAAAPADTAIADMPAAAAPATNGSTAADTMAAAPAAAPDSEAPHLAAALADAQQRLMDLARELTAKAEAAAMWQARADMLAGQLAAAHAQLAALGPGQVGGGDAGTPASDRPRPWWRRLCWWRH
jgi:excisionase family DNA binding protein